MNMVTIGPFYPTAASNQGSGADWVGLQNILSDGGGFAYVNMSGSHTPTKMLVATAFKDASGSSPAIPANASNVVATFDWKKRRDVSIQCDDASSRLVKAGVVGSDDKSKSGHWPIAFTHTPYSWGVSPADANDIGFGASISGKEVADDSMGTVYVDTCRLTITYEI